LTSKLLRIFAENTISASLVWCDCAVTNGRSGRGGSASRARCSQCP